MLSEGHALEESELTRYCPQKAAERMLCHPCHLSAVRPGESRTTAFGLDLPDYRHACLA